MFISIVNSDEVPSISPNIEEDANSNTVFQFYSSIFHLIANALISAKLKSMQEYYLNIIKPSSSVFGRVKEKKNSKFSRFVELDLFIC